MIQICKPENNIGPFWKYEIESLRLPGSRSSRRFNISLLHKDFLVSILGLDFSFSSCVDSVENTGLTASALSGLDVWEQELGFSKQAVNPKLRFYNKEIRNREHIQQTVFMIEPYFLIY